MIHTVKGFSVVKEAEVDVFLEFSCFFYDPTDVGNLIIKIKVYESINAIILSIYISINEEIKKIDF